VHDFLNVVRKLKNNLAVNKSEPVEILNFGLVNSELKVLQKKEAEMKEIKKRDFMAIIRNS
jgi:hypothetical protein